MIHKYTLNDFHIVLDVSSGAVHIFNDAPYEMLDYLEDTVPQTPPQEMLKVLGEKYDRETIDEAYSELRELFENGQLFSPDGYHDFTAMLKEAPVKSMCLNVAHDCNLRCEYCFAA